MVKIEQTGGRLTEEEILHGKEDAYGIYQINRKGAGRDYAFLSFDSLRSKGKVPERTEYQLVYSDILGADENRDSLFTKFNIAHPDDFTGHSLSVSDIILIKRNGKVNVSYVDMIGFVPLPDFYKEPSLRVVEQITESTKGFTAEGHFGTWHSIQMQEFHNEKFFQMRHDEFGEQVADIIVNEQGQVIAEDLWHGFSPEAMKLIGEYLLSKSLYQKKEVAYLLPDNGYFMIHETDGGYDYTFYNHEFKELDGGVYDNPEVSIAEATEDILNDEGITIENIRETDYEQLEQDIEEAEYIVKVDFYVAECSEFPSLGEYHEGLTLDEAIKIYEKIPEERMHGRKGIGIDLHFPEENLYPGKCSLFEGGEICREFLDIVPFYKENKEVQRAVNYLENHFNKKEKSLMKPKKPEQAPRL